jgi:hemerythrin-like domain-containing protein
MPVQIGAKTHNFDDPTGLLSDCHRRIEMFLGSLETVAKTIDQPPSENTRQALLGSLRYFAEAAPKHTADEEESLFPRLRQINNAEIQSAFERMDSLEDDHRYAASLHVEVQRLGTQYLSTGKLSHVDARLFRDAVASLASLYKHHIRIEDELIFPVAAKVLSDAEKKYIAEEMKNRREAP